MLGDPDAVVISSAIAEVESFVGVPLGDLVAVPARLRNNGRWHFGYPV